MSDCVADINFDRHSCSRMYSYDYDCMLQVNRGWTVSEVRQWAQRTALLGASGFLVLAGFVDIPGQ